MLTNFSSLKKCLCNKNLVQDKHALDIAEQERKLQKHPTEDSEGKKEERINHQLQDDRM